MQLTQEVKYDFLSGYLKKKANLLNCKAIPLVIEDEEKKEVNIIQYYITDSGKACMFFV